MLGNIGHGIRDPQDVIASSWAYRQTGDERFAEIGWSLARGTTALVPDIDLNTKRVPYYPYAYCGGRIYRQHLMPMLVGASVGHELRYESGRPQWFRDLFLILQPSRDNEPKRLTAYVRPSKAGDVALNIVTRVRGDVPLTARATSIDGRVIGEASTPTAGWPRQATLKLMDVKAGHVYRIEIKCTKQAAVQIAGSAQVVWHTPPERMYANEPLSGGQYYTPQYLISRSTGGPIAYFNRHQRPYAIRGVERGELLLRGQKFTADEKTKPVKSGQMIEFVVRGSRGWSEWSLTGVEPFIASSTDNWFDPRKYGWKTD
jgi:hypothetical protein